MINTKKYKKLLIAGIISDVRNTTHKQSRPSMKDHEEWMNEKFHVTNKMPDNKHKDSLVCSNHSVKGGKREMVVVLWNGGCSLVKCVQEILDYTEKII